MKDERREAGGRTEKWPEEKREREKNGERNENK